MKTETLNYQADGLDMVATLVLPDDVSAPRPGVLVFPHAFGPGAHSRGKAEQLAGLGYVALECDLWGGARGADMSGIGELMQPLRESAEKVRARTLAPLERLAARPEVDASRIAAVGSGLRPWATRSNSRRSWTMLSKQLAPIQRWVCW